MKLKSLFKLGSLALPILACGASGPVERIELSELDTGNVVQGWGHAGVNRSVSDSPLSIGGEVYDSGVGTHGPGVMQIDLGGQALRFHAVVGIDDGAGRIGSSEFLVIGDGKTLYESGVLRKGERAKEIDLNVENVSMLTLQTTDGGDGFHHDHANWADAWIEYVRPEDVGREPRMLPHRDDELYEASGWEGHSHYEVAKPVSLPFSKTYPGKITDYMVLTFTSDWGDEYRVKTQRLTEQGYHYLETAGQSSGGQKPFVILYNLEKREGIAVSLAWSGNWALDIEQEGDEVRLTARTSPANLPAIKEIGDLALPGALVSEFSGHWDYGTLPIRRYVRKHLLRDLGESWPIVQYNEYFDNKGHFTEESLIEAAQAAASAGVEYFVIDAGWFGNNFQWRRSIGDWFVNEEKLPNGLEPVAKAVRDLGMKFGLWVSMECISKDSDLIRKHPEWVLGDIRTIQKPVPEDPRDWEVGDLDDWYSNVGPIINMDLGNSEALAHQKSVIKNLMDNYDLDYIKMDFNVSSRTGSEAYDGSEDPLYGHLEGTSELWTWMRQTYPGLVIENCSSGSKRADVMTAAMTDTHWTSDEVDNIPNLLINYGATYLFPPEICSDWTTYPEEEENKHVLDIPARFTTNMFVHFGLSGEIQDWRADTMRTLKERISTYKEYRPIVRNADVYHLTRQPNHVNPQSATAVQLVDTRDNKSIHSLVYAFQSNDPELRKRLRLRELDPSKRYQISFPDEFGGDTVVAEGSDLLSSGLKIDFQTKGTAGIVEIRALLD